MSRASASRRRRLALFAAGGVVAGALLWGNLSRPGHDPRPNILFLLTDDQRWDALGVMGNPVIRTPALDRLANDGMLFTNAFVVTSICAVSRASVLSGQYPSRHGIRDFVTTFTREAMAQTYPLLLGDSGYFIGFIGKWGVGYTVDSTNLAGRSFDYWAGASDQSNYWHERSCRYVTHDGRDRQMSNVCDCPPDARGAAGPAVRRGRANIKDPVHLTTEVIPGKVAQFLETREVRKPFALSISFKAPHGPWYDFAPEVAGMYEDVSLPRSATAELAAVTVAPFLRESLNFYDGRALLEEPGRLESFLRDYYRQITGIDRAVGRIREELRKRGLAENTVIVFTSDNGHFAGEHGFQHKWLMYEESIRVPMIVYDPRLRRTGRHKSREMVLNIDVAPTLLELGGVEIPEGMQGKSMVPLLTRPRRPFRDIWFYEHHFSEADPRRRIERSEGVRTRRFKYIRYIDREPPLPHEELYDLASDPGETRNLVGRPEYGQKLAELRRRYERLREVRGGSSSRRRPDGRRRRAP